MSRLRSAQNGVLHGDRPRSASPPGTDGAQRLSDSFPRLRVMLWEDTAEINTFYFAC